MLQLEDRYGLLHGQLKSLVLDVAENAALEVLGVDAPTAAMAAGSTRPLAALRGMQAVMACERRAALVCESVSGSRSEVR